MSAWGGSQNVANEVQSYGWVTSRKRAATSALSRSNPGSDHNTANTNSYAIDFATFNGAPLAYKIAHHYGLGNYRTGNYNRYHIKRGGATFAIQILWAVQGHFNHVHLGVRRIGGTYRPVKKDPYRVLTKPEKRLAHKVDYHQRKRSRSKGAAHRRQDRWVKFWAYRVKRQMRRLQKDARAKGKGGWKRDNRGARYQALDRSLNK